MDLRTGHWEQARRQDTLDEATRDVLEASTLPPRYYTDPGIFEAEKGGIFFREWLCVGRQEQIPNPGDYFSITILGEPLIVVRGKDNQVRVMSAVCRHRAMIITAPSDGEYGDWYKRPEETRGNCSAFKCPFHFWTYNLEGALVGAPEMTKTQEFHRSDIRLPGLAVELWNGFIFVNFADDPVPLAPQLHHVDDILANWNIGDMKGGEPAVLPEMPCNWKVVQEGAEAYHLDRLHFPLHRVMPSDGLVPKAFQIPEGSSGIPFAVRCVRPDYGLNPVERALLPPIETLSREQRQTTTWTFVLPTLLIGAMCDSAFYRIVHPVSVDRTDVRQSYLAPAVYHEMTMFEEILEMQESFHLRLNHQDYMTQVAVQRGLSSRLAPQGRLAWQEEVLVHLNRWLVARYKAQGI